MTTLSKKDIENLLPHREPMLLIEKLTKIVPLKSATALVNVRKPWATPGGINRPLRLSPCISTISTDRNVDLFARKSQSATRIYPLGVNQ